MLERSNAQCFAGAPCACDVFVSYSRGDPKKTGKAPSANWTHRLMDELLNDIHSASTEFDQIVGASQPGVAAKPASGYSLTAAQPSSAD